jgi:hypothetical protein
VHVPLTISGKTLGGRRPLFADFSVPVPPDFGPNDGGGGGGATLRDLIAHVVRHEVAAFRKRQDARRFLRVLSEREIEQGLEKGKVEAGGSESRQSVDEDEAIGTALQAFEDGLYLVLIDGEEQRELDRQIFLQPDSRITFVRLVFLAGA